MRPHRRTSKYSLWHFSVAPFTVGFLTGPTDSTAAFTALANHRSPSQSTPGMGVTYTHVCYRQPSRLWQHARQQYQQLQSDQTERPTPVFDRSRSATGIRTGAIHHRESPARKTIFRAV